jgi:carboxylesterase type B
LLSNAGSLVSGYAEWYGNLQTLALGGQVLLISINYRLGAFGFLAHPVLGEVDPRGVSGNYGILDQQLALQWVQRNAHNFGGDPGQVTLIGQSSGGTSIYALLSSPHSVGLFHAAISLSASPNMTMDLQAAYQQNSELVQKACPQGSSSLVLECLYGLKPFDVANMFTKSYNGMPLLPQDTSGQFYKGWPPILLG